MTIDDLPDLKRLLRELEVSHQRMQAESRNLGRTMEEIIQVCSDEPDLLRVINREKGYLNDMKRLLDDFPLIRQVRRRLTTIEAKVRESEYLAKDEDAQVQRQAEQVRDSLKDVIQRFLR